MITETPTKIDRRRREHKGPRLPKGPSPSEAAEMQAADTKLPAFSIAERRAQNGDLRTLAEPDPEVLLMGVDEPMATRWIYTGQGAPIGRFHEVTERKGWVQVHAKHIKHDPKLYGWGKSPEGFIVRGEKGEEVLVMMPSRIYKAIQFRTVADNDRKRQSANGLNDLVRNELGDTDQRIAHMEVTAHRETRERS